MSKTFYIASSSEPENLPSVRTLAAELEARGYVWSFDWTEVVEGQLDPAEWPPAAEVDINAARSCDLFILLRNERPSKGAHVELGTRLGVKRTVHLITRHTQRHFFYYHDLVTCYDTVEQFLSNAPL